MPASEPGEFSSSRVRTRGRGLDRHGRGMRSPVTGPHLPVIHGRTERFFTTVAQTAQYLRSLWSTELTDVSFEVAANPSAPLPPGEIPRWSVNVSQKRIVLFRVPIQRLSRLHVDDEIHRQMAIEECVFRAVAEFLGRRPEELGPERFHP